MCFLDVFSENVLHFLFTPVPRENELKCPPRQTQNLKGKRSWLRPMKKHFPVVAGDKHLSRCKQRTSIWEAVLSLGIMSEADGQTLYSMVSSVVTFEMFPNKPFSFCSNAFSLPWPCKNSVPTQQLFDLCFYLFSMPISPILDQNLTLQISK